MSDQIVIWEASHATTGVYS